MKNLKKFVAAFAAAAMAMSMGVSAFAEVLAPVQNDAMYDAETKELTFLVGEENADISISDEEQITVMAYTVPSDTTLANIPDFNADVHTIIALDQKAGETGFSTIPVDEQKLNANTSIVVKVGGSNGDVATYLIALQKEVITYSVTFNYNGGTGTTASKEFDDDDTVADVTADVAVTVPTEEGFTYEFLGWSATANGDVLAGTTLMTSLLADENAESVTLFAIYEKTADTPPVETITVYIGDINSDNVVDVKDFNQMKTYNNLTEALKANYKGKVGTMIGSIYIGDINSDNVVDVKDFNQMKTYNNLTEALKANYKGKVGTTVTIEVSVE